ncbi:MAG: hypothetical protein ACI8UO_005088 [Verrucomicrobiales bacterium]|jgi:hypothetical protein
MKPDPLKSPTYSFLSISLEGLKGSKGGFKSLYELLNYIKFCNF